MNERIQNYVSYENIISTGFESLDRVLDGGLRRGSVTHIAGLPGMGKTSLALQLAVSAARETGSKSLIFSVGKPSWQIRARVRKLCTRADEPDIVVDDTADITPSYVRLRLSHTPGVGAVVIDYLQLMTADESIKDHREEMTAVLRELADIARETGVAFIIVFMAAKPLKLRGRRHGSMGLREYGCIERDADAVLLLRRKPDPGDPGEGGTVELVAAKNRYNGADRIILEFCDDVFRE